MMFLRSRANRRWISHRRLYRPWFRHPGSEVFPGSPHEGVSYHIDAHTGFKWIINLNMPLAHLSAGGVAGTVWQAGNAEGCPSNWKAKSDVEFPHTVV